MDKHLLFEPIDLSMAQHVGALTQEEIIAVAYLSFLTRLGHFCLFCHEGQIFPDPKITIGDIGDQICIGFSTLKNCPDLYPSELKNWNLGSAKASGFDLSLEPKSNSSARLGIHSGIIQEGHYWYFARRYHEEQTIVQNYQRLLNFSPNKTVDPLILEERLAQDISLLTEQKQAIRQSLRHSVTLITGGPGTGKTYTASKLIEYLRFFYPDLRLALAAPTGKAAAHLQNTLGALSPAQTLHRLLDYRLRQQEPSLLRYDLILIDESSMVDCGLFAKLLSAIESGTRVIFLGDPDQLPPVEGGAVFHDLIEWHKQENLSWTHLSQCRRTELITILDLAAAVRKGDVDYVSNVLQENLSINIINQLKIPFLSDALSEETLLSVFEKRVILTPLREGPFGTQMLNQACLEKYGDRYAPIMITHNDSDVDLANGQVGVLVKQDREMTKGDYALFREGSAIRKIPALLLPQFEFAYCLSIHKSQGSEYDEVIVLVPEGSERFGRELLYTAITRAKKKVELFGNVKSLALTIRNHAHRFSRIVPLR